MEKAMQIQAIVFQFKRPRATTYAPIVGINDRDDIMWSDSKNYDMTIYNKKSDLFLHLLIITKVIYIIICS
jgi:hypothetical protein